MTALTLTEGATGGTGWVKAAGEVDVYSAALLRESLSRLIEHGHRDIVLDLAGCTFLDNTGLGVIVGGLRRCRADGGDLRLACDKEALLKIFRITGLIKVFRIFDSRDEAVAATSGGKHDD